MLRYFVFDTRSKVRKKEKRQCFIHAKMIKTTSADELLIPCNWGKNKPDTIQVYTLPFMEIYIEVEA